MVYEFMIDSKKTFDMFVSNILIHDKTFNKLFEYIIMLKKSLKNDILLLLTLNKITNHIILKRRKIRYYFIVHNSYFLILEILIKSKILVYIILNQYSLSFILI